MPTESQPRPLQHRSPQLDDPDPPNGDEQINSYASIKTLAKRLSGPLWLRISPDFAKRQGSNVLLVMGIVLFVLGCEACATGQTTVAAFFVPLGLLAVVIAARMGELVKLKIGGGIAEFVESDATDEGPGSDA